MFNQLRILICLIFYSISTITHDLSKAQVLESEFEELSSKLPLTSHKFEEGHIGRLYDLYTQAYNRPASSFRKEIFQTNLEKIIAHNRKGASWTMGVNQFSDLTFEEFRYSFLMHEPQNCSATSYNYLFKNANVPDNFDWRDYYVITPVKNQLHCGSCWTFSTTGAVEAHWKLYHHTTVELSEQQLVDCAGDFDNHGCNGGLPSHAFEYIKYAGGLQGEDTYPYEAVNKECRFNKDQVIAKVVLGSVNITALDESAVVEALAIDGPVSVAFQVIDDFMLYKNGVYSSTECKNGPMDVNHAVLAVGYGIDVDSGKQFYIVKNSWSSSWGDQGYFKIERGVNMCGIGQCNSYPNVGKCANKKIVVSSV